ncbi:hypothetical protein ACIA8C_04040 [Nocardia sp. NPDC051321]|uniref:hypothetical protein n=1 Tax=Nocardia sp. NPDC051321 TaxID=3364323 RepID=UPI00378AE544
MKMGRPKQLDSIVVTGVHNVRTRRLALAAAGFLIASTVGYNVVNAPSSTAADEETCPAGVGSFEVENDKNRDSDPDEFVMYADGSFGSSGRCAGGFNVMMDHITFTADTENNTCIFRASTKGGTAVKQDNQDHVTERETVKKGNRAEITVPLNGDPATFTAVGTVGNDDVDNYTGTVKGHGIKKCDAIPIGEFTVTDLVSTPIR